MSSRRAMREIACVMHVPTRWASEAIRPRASDRGHPSELCEGIRGQEESREEQEECMATYKVARSAWRPTRSPGVHGDLQGRPECMATYAGKLPRRSVARRSSCHPGDLLGRHVFPASYERDCMCHARSNTLGIRSHSTEGIRPRASERAMRGHPRARGITRGAGGVHGDLQGRHGDLQGRQECMATYKVARSAWRPMLGSCHAVGRPEGMATYGQHCAIRPI
ncbi:hypothetical protein F3Y22_tig00110556pilonHSYRG00349 [Hibiscus syriacus]|uniref:Uncharacterized protein n=1 Tax=Hibiscus syriacus TaxID=106335 RepID=A0A6A3A867_HIBSY|nr:hypothetical protein F3Y22_tig00110556pilonHSYRG00349 [Hibiscus syriacus]